VSESDRKVSAAYRSIAREEPSAALDAAILSASRSALVKPSASRRWAAPVSIAAVLVLAFGVTLRMQQEKPGVESPDMDATRPAQRAAVPAAPPAAEKFEDKAVAEPPLPMKQAAQPREEARAKKNVAPAAKPDTIEADRALRDDSRVESERKDLKERAAASTLAKEANVAMPEVAAAAAPAPQAKLQAAAPPAAARAFAPEPPASPAAPAASAPAPARLKREANAAQAPAGAAADAQAVDETTRELEAIAKLRVEGRHAEADKALAEFRRKRPDYRIPDAMWERVKPR
jgi:hypothetical protein